VASRALTERAIRIKAATLLWNFLLKINCVPSGQHSSNVMMAVRIRYQFLSFEPSDSSKALAVKTRSTFPRLTAFCSNDRWRFSVLDRLIVIAIAS
jgi:hypothetical protein